MKFSFIILFFSWITFYAQTPIVKINEIVSSNSIYEDEDGEKPDWIEMFNTSSSPLNLLNYSLSDNTDNPSKWIFPDISIDPGQYLVIFASGKDRYGDELHTNFSIKAEGEVIILTDADQQIIDQVEATTIPPDFSFGRNISNINDWLFYPNPTPGGANNTDGYSGFAEVPIFSLIGGFYSGIISLELSTESDIADIYYTTDGSEPTISATEYSTPISINNTTVIRAKAFTGNLLPSKITTHTYLINENLTLPVVSLSTNPDNFFDDEIGIYVEGNGDIPNYDQDWERPIHIEFYENNGSLGFGIDGGIQIHGGQTREYNQKSFAIIARGEYGYSSIPYKFFPQLDFNEYDSFLLRMAGNDNFYAHIRDPFIHNIVDDLDIENQSSRPAIVFLNGEYWGLYYIRERVNKDYLAQYHDIDVDNVDLLRSSTNVIEGDNANYLALLNYLQNSDLSEDIHYNYIKNQINLTNYINYQLTQMYIVNDDWYGNIKLWRPKTIDGKWRWILFDTDNGFDLYSRENIDWNMIWWVENSTKEPSIFFKNLIANQNFQQKFINTFADLANSSFKTDNILSLLDSLKTIVEPEMLRQFQKWGKEWQWAKGLLYWNNHIQNIIDFGENRLPYMWQHFQSRFGLGSPVVVTLSTNESEGGFINLNSLVLNSFPWNGEYFQGFPITLEAIPKPGYKFVGWTGSIESSERIISYTPTENNEITAVFELDNQTYPIVINEINYHSTNEIIGDPASPDWIEFYNNSDNPIDLSGWQFKDEGNTFIFPSSTILNGREYLVLADTVVNFKYYYPSATKVLDEGLGFKFDNGGEALALYSLNGALVDNLRYNDKAPWPTEPDGDGPTLELVHPDLDNSIGDSWRSSNPDNSGTPGSINDSYRNIYDPVEIPKIVINEINYNPPDEVLPRPNWIELYNNSDQPVDLSGWKFKDKDHTFLFPIGITLDSRGYLVLTDTLINFQHYYPAVTNVLSEGFGFGLSSGGELLRLLNSSEILIDMVDYDVVPPWPTEPDDTGPTLELIHPDFNNELPENWRASSNDYGTPGILNSMIQNKIVVNVKVFLEGAYVSSNNMSSSISQNGDFPLTQPFNTEPLNYQGTETIIEVPNEEITDWVLVELRENTGSENIFAQKAALLKSNGSVVSLDGESDLAFYNLSIGDYYLTIHHRNHLSVMSSGKITISE